MPRWGREGCVGWQLTGKDATLSEQRKRRSSPGDKHRDGVYIQACFLDFTPFSKWPGLYKDQELEVRKRRVFKSHLKPSLPPLPPPGPQQGPLLVTPKGAPFNSKQGHLVISAGSGIHNQDKIKSLTPTSPQCIPRQNRYELEHDDSLLCSPAF